MRDRAGAVLLALAAFALTACSAVGGAAAESAPSIGGEKTPVPGAGLAITLRGPDLPVPLGQDPLALIIEVSDEAGAVTGAEVTFIVVSGPGRFPGGFGIDTTDDFGVATVNELQVTDVGTIEVEIATAEHAIRLPIEVVAE